MSSPRRRSPKPMGSSRGARKHAGSSSSQVLAPCASLGESRHDHPICSMLGTIRAASQPWSLSQKKSNSSLHRRDASTNQEAATQQCTNGTSVPRSPSNNSKNVWRCPPARLSGSSTSANHCPADRAYGRAKRLRSASASADKLLGR
jgi:hypothetical protein